jgi:AcrR family transcriptional regulator
VPAALLPRDAVVARIQDVFRDHGFDGASLAEIAHATGLGKSSLYHYFPGGKDEMATAVLQRIEAWMDAHVLATLRARGTPNARLRTMLRVLDEFYAGGRNACVLGNLVVGGSRATFQAHLAAAFGGWIAALRALAVEAGVRAPEAQRRAEDAVVRIQGALIVAGGLGDPAPFKRALRNIERDLLA